MRPAGQGQGRTASQQLQQVHETELEIVYEVIKHIYGIELIIIFHVTFNIPIIRGIGMMIDGRVDIIRFETSVLKFPEPQKLTLRWYMGQYRPGPPDLIPLFPARVRTPTGRHRASTNMTRSDPSVL